MNRARQAIESRYNGICTVYEYMSVKDEVTKLTEQKEVATLENQPCKLSYEKINATDTNGAAIQSMGTKLFISPEVEIKPGSKVVVTQNGVTTEFSNSGKPAIYTNHQEIMLKLFENYA